MKKLTKKQMIATGAVVILGIGGITVGVVNHNQNVQAQQLAKTKAHEAKVKADKKAKAEQLAKEKEAAQQKQVATLLATATANPSDNSIKAVNDAIAKLTDQKEKAKDNELVKALNARLSLIKKAEAAVKDYQGYATDANKQKVAQEAINNLKDKNDQDVKSQLQKLFDESNKQAQEAAKSAQANQKASSTTGTNNNAKSTDTQTNDTPAVAESGTNNQAASNVNSGNNTYVPNTPNTGGGSNTASNSNSNNSSNNGGGNTNNNNSNNNSNSNNNNSGGGNVTPPVSHVFQAWVKNKAGVVIWTQNCSTWAEASQAAANYGNSQFASGNFDIGNYGVTQIS
ncbi:hypothetical protein LLD17_06980 [Lactococcus cremoris]|uniref:hypothetical protein n=1 Tax=Lactococcus TaxID=1357 RepID=UPI00223AC9A2|nr:MULTISPECIES: hypothetical protein [Lactococcus]MCT0056320.1 hypothetical protein [Lactococcus lactis subsp. lactis]MDT2862272.1 hypothetical protein [Lactococcus lactis]MDT2867892.1 hypothetical protein [Lactococcus lactis]MDT2883456.1 hypothetical protein [Lactococcus lactis]MDT2897326.1 hypothetical protein [Lactococcus lactis]